MKEGAWEFLEFLILRQEEEAASVRYLDFPVYLPALEAKLTCEKEHIVRQYVDDQGLWHSEEDIETIREIIDSAMVDQVSTRPLK